MTSQPKILIVDDDHDTLDLLEIYLYRKYDIITAMNGFEGLAKAEAEQPGLIMTDITMPVIDGIGFINGLRKNENTKLIPVLAITSFDKEHTIKSLLSVGFGGVITKPPDREKILSLVEKFMNNGTPGAKTRRKRQPKNDDETAG